MQRNDTREPSRASIPIYVGRHIVGYVRGGVFHKTLRSNHFLQKPPAIAFDVSTLRDAEQAGAQRVEIVDAESKRIYRAAISTIWTNGFRLNRGFGRQIALPLAEWNRDTERAEQLELFEVAT